MEESRKLIENYFKTYPGIRRYMDETIKNARENGYVETLYKRRRRMKNLNSSNKPLK